MRGGGSPIRARVRAKAGSIVPSASSAAVNLSAEMPIRPPALDRRSLA
jgi:hypothetical protein